MPRRCWVSELSRGWHRGRRQDSVITATGPGRCIAASLTWGQGCKRAALGVRAAALRRRPCCRLARRHLSIELKVSDVFAAHASSRRRAGASGLVADSWTRPARSSSWRCGRRRARRIMLFHHADRGAGHRQCAHRQRRTKSREIGVMRAGMRPRASASCASFLIQGGPRPALSARSSALD